MSGDGAHDAGRMDRTALSYWFPIIEAAGLPVPRTIIVPMPEAAMEAAWAALDGKDAGDMQPFLNALKDAAFKVGFPFFLRTDHTSAKHEWSRSCFVTTVPDIERAVDNIIYHSELAGIMGLSYENWAVRELLPTMPLSWCPQFGGMPICREFRFFVDGDNVRCWHPYWPKKALEQGGAPKSLDFDALCRLSIADIKALCAIASRAGSALGGAWSVDLLETERGWFLTDMAEAEKSFHWEGCEADEPSRRTDLNINSGDGQ